MIFVRNLLFSSRLPAAVSWYNGRNEHPLWIALPHQMESMDSIKIGKVAPFVRQPFSHDQNFHHQTDTYTNSDFKLSSKNSFWSAVFYKTTKWIEWHNLFLFSVRSVFNILHELIFKFFLSAFKDTDGVERRLESEFFLSVFHLFNMLLSRRSSKRALCECMHTFLVFLF